MFEDRPVGLLILHFLSCDKLITTADSIQTGTSRTRLDNIPELNIPLCGSQDIKNRPKII